MRKCLRCGSEMLEDWEPSTENSRVFNGLIITNGKSFFKGEGRKGILKAALCPSCGEVSLYVDDPDTVVNGWR